MKKTIIVFSGEFDKVTAAFVIANGAAAMDDEVTMFFTFWGLNALRKDMHVPTAGKTVLQKMFGAMMPRAGGQYNYLGAAFGRAWAFAYGWTATLVEGAASNAATRMI